MATLNDAAKSLVDIETTTVSPVRLQQRFALCREIPCKQAKFNEMALPQIQ
jgi:hypothetical protein